MPTTFVNIRNAPYNAHEGIDCYSAFQQAMLDMSPVKGNIYVPAGIYNVSKPFYHRDFVTMYGDGNTSIIENTVPVQNGDDQFCLHIGNFRPSDFSKCIRYKLSNIKGGTNRVALSTKRNISHFTVGKMVFIDTTNGFINSDGDFKPYQAFINRVVGVSKLNGIITLEDIIPSDISNARIAVTDAFITNSGLDPTKVYIIQQPRIHDMRFESLGDWTMRFGCYKGIFQNISIKSTDVLPGNGFSHCTFTNITATFSQKVIEMATYSHESIVNGLTATWDAGGVIDPANKPLIKMGENMRLCEFYNISINSGQGTNFENVIRAEHAFDNKIHDSTFVCPTVTGAGAALTSNDDTSIVTGNQFYSSTFELGAADYDIDINTSGSLAVIMNNSITNNTFTGGVLSETVHINGGSNNTTSPNTYS